MNKFTKFLCLALMVVAIPCCFMFAGCQTAVVVQSIEKTGTSGLVDTYTITYTDGSTSTFTITNGRDGNDGANGQDGQDGADGENFSVTDAYNKYLEENPGATYEDFLRSCVTVQDASRTAVVGRCLLSSVKLYTEYRVTKTSSGFLGSQSYKDNVRSGGSGVIYKIEDDWTYMITNYHVVYNASANADNGSYIARRIVGYLYGSEGPNGYATDDGQTKKLDTDGYPMYDYGTLGIDMEYVGGSAEKDIAVIRARTADIEAINPDARAITFANDYHVGEVALAVGNTEGEGISVTEGIVSVDSENVTLSIDTVRDYRSMRIDTAIYHGNSGGGLFNAVGELIGITNAGDETDENVNYAIPLDIVRNTVENIMYYFFDEDQTTNGAYKVLLGVTVVTENTKYVYDNDLGYGKIEETLVVDEIIADSIFSKLNALVDDQLISMFIGQSPQTMVEYKLNTSYNIGDLLLTLRVGDIIQFKLSRPAATAGDPANIVTSNTYTITSTDLVKLA